MSNAESVALKEKRSFLRSGLPWLVVVLAALTFIGVWAWPSEDLSRARRAFVSSITFMVSILLLTGWLIFFSGYRRVLRLGVAAGVVALLLIAFWNVDFDGDVAPSFRWPRWIHESLLESDRQAQAGKGSAPPVEWTEGKASDFPGYLGRSRDGIVTGPALAKEWQTPPPQLWKQRVGGGYSAFSVVGNAAVTIEQRRDQEVVTCYDTVSGRERWAYAYDAAFREKLGGDGPRATPTIDKGDVFSLGATGILVCLDLRTGTEKWKQHILEGNSNITWGMSGSPLVFDDLVVVNPGAQSEASAGKALVAYERGTGKVRWQSGTTKAGYSSPMLAMLGGRQQIVLLDGQQVAGYDSKEGKQLWRYEWPTMQDINVAQPLVTDRDHLFISSGYDHGCMLLRISEGDGKWTATPVWDKPKLTMRCKFTSPVLLKGHIYGLDEGILACIDAKSGNRKWKGERYGHGQILLAEDRIIVLAESGKLVLVEATPEASRELGSFQAVTGRKTWNPLAIADGKVYVRNADEMACYDLTRE